MTRQEKIEWLANATPEELINQLRWSVTGMTAAQTIAVQIEAQENYALVTAELLKRMK